MVFQMTCQKLKAVAFMACVIWATRGGLFAQLAFTSANSVNYDVVLQIIIGAFVMDQSDID